VKPPISAQPPERRAHLSPLPLLAYTYTLQRLRQQRIQRPPQHPLQHRLANRLALDCLVQARRLAAIVDLVNGETAQARAARHLLGGECNLDPSIGCEYAPRVLLDVGAACWLRSGRRDRAPRSRGCRALCACCPEAVVRSR